MFRLTILRLGVAMCCALLIRAAACGETITVEPGPGALAAALANADAGDVIELAPGRYEESVSVPEGVTIDGKDADAVTVAGTEFAALRLTGTDITIRNITFEGSDAITRGISGERSVRIERCRFNNIPEAIGLRLAPLSDVICCEFNNCEISVRAIGKASPTIWGCRFNGGRLGVFAMHGAPRICNNIFHGQETGILLVADGPDTQVVRNNIFSSCTKSGIEIRGGDMPFPSASVRNCIFVGCKTVAIGDDELLMGISHCAVNECGELTLDAAKHALLTEPVGLKLNDDGTFTIADAALLEDRGMRSASEEKGTTRDIGIDGNLTRCGVHPNPEATVPPVRFQSRPRIVNGTSEEYVYMQMCRMRMGGQALMNKDGRMLDVQTVTTASGDQQEIEFDITGFFGESAFMEP